MSKLVAFLKKPAVIKTVSVLLLAAGGALATGKLDVHAVLSAISAALGAQ